MATRFLEYLASGVRDSSGNVLASGLVYVYDAGTTTTRTSYQDYELATPHTNPIVLDAYGRANVWVDRRVKLAIHTSAGVSVRTLDDVGGVSDYEIDGSDIANDAILPRHLSDAALNALLYGSVVSVESSDYTLATSDGIGMLLVTTGNSNRTITFPPATENTNREITIKKVDTGTGNFVMDGYSLETLEDATTQTGSLQYETYTWRCNGTEWFLKNKHIPTVTARYSRDSAQQIESGTEIFDFDDVSNDSHSCVTTGAAWKFTAPRAGRYQLTCYVSLVSNAGWDDGEVMALEVFKNGTKDAVIWALYVQATGTLIQYGGGSVSLTLAKSDYIDVRITQNSGGNINSEATAANNWVAVESHF